MDAEEGVETASEERDDIGVSSKKRPLPGTTSDAAVNYDSTSRRKLQRLDDCSTSASVMSTAVNSDVISTSSSRLSKNSLNITNNNNSSSRRRRAVRFLPDPENVSAVATEIKTFEIDYDLKDVWWTKEECRELCERQSSLLGFYQNNLPDMVDSCLLVWINCAEQALDDGNFCMTLDQRATIAENISDSPVRGFERELAADLIIEQRVKTIGGLLELQELCRTNTNLAVDEKLEAMAAASEAFSQAATLFAREIASADARCTHHL